MDTFGQRYRKAWELWRAAHPSAGRDETRFVEAAGMKMSTASPYKNQIEPPIYARVLAIAKTAGVDPGWLMFGGDSQAPVRKAWPEGDRGEVEPTARPAHPQDGAQKRGKRA